MDLSTQIKRGTDIFYGNDVYGRGTFGGGRYNTSIGVNEINKYNLSTAIFAPGYVYENNGKARYSKFE